jgi:hypothetical protein
VLPVARAVKDFLARLGNSLAQLNKFSRRHEGILPLIA